ncbi:MAG: response regulator [Pseudobacteriovorax sp.]|nr:response regulator [Pseudobacteriovorax sp.]
MAKFLLADDSEFVRFEISEILKEMGHEVCLAEDGGEGFRLAKSHDDFDFILSDFNMPVWDGLKMIENIRTLEPYKHTPVGMLTTESSRNLKMRGRELGISVWYIKPLDKELFKKTLTMVLEGLNDVG